MLTDISHVFALLIFLQFSSASILKLNNLSSLEEALAKYDNPNFIVIVNAHKDRKTDTEEEIQNENVSNLKKNNVLIRKIVPHTLDEGKIEYDYNYNAFYKPLLRIHRNKRTHLESTERNDQTMYDNIDIQNKRDSEVFNAKNVFKAFEDEYDISKSGENKKSVGISDDIWDGVTWNSGLQQIKPYSNDDNLIKITKIANKNKPYPKFNYDNNELLRQLELLIDIYHHLNKIKSRSRKLKSYGKIMPTLKKIDGLRANYDKSGEDNDPLAPGNEEHEQKEEKQAKFWMPYYPPWNYWTYKKTLHQDECPGNQVKVGNMCIWIQPH